MTQIPSGVSAKQVKDYNLLTNKLEKLDLKKHLFKSYSENSSFSFAFMVNSWLVGWSGLSKERASLLRLKHN